MAHSSCHFLARRAPLSAVFVHLVGTWGCDGRVAQRAPDTTEVSLIASNTEAAAYPPGVSAEAPAGQPAGLDGSGADPGAVGRTSGSKKAQGKLLGSFALTYYWIAHERDRRGKRTTRIYAPDCKPIARVSRDFAARLAREGTGKLRDERVVNVAGPCACEYSPCFFHLDDEKSRFGVGVLERPLSPFRSVAVDPNLVTIGTALYIPELDGLAMPGTPPWGGFVHDGCVIADDRGGAVEGQQIDFFMVRKVYYQAFHRRHRLKQITVHHGGERCSGLRADGVAADRNAI
jgi:3D (Asp-Asp-Asp) domain-containing protein